MNPRALGGHDTDVVTNRTYAIVVCLATIIITTGACSSSGGSGVSSTTTTAAASATTTSIPGRTSTVERTTTTTPPVTQGPTGPTGPPGPPGVSGYVIVQDSKTVPVNNANATSGSVDASVSCPAGKFILSGGAAINSLPHDVSDFAFLERSEPVGTSSWAATAEWNHTELAGPGQAPQLLTLTVHAICATVI